MERTTTWRPTSLPEEFHEALERWRVRANEILCGREIQWPAKLASTTFTYRGEPYEICPEDVFPKEEFQTTPENFLHAGFEILQGTIGRDLIQLGAEDIQHWGCLD